jgi:upstream activation factor subunit UAF30
MPRTKTTKSVSNVEQVVSVNSVTEQPQTLSTSSVPDVVVSKPVRKPKAPKATVETTPTSTSVDPVSSSEEVVELEVPITEQSSEFISKLQQISVAISSLKAEYRILEKKWAKELKAAQKIQSKKKRKGSNRAPSGFVKPTRISDELAKFLDKPSGSEMARTEVTRDINKYIRTNNLQDKENGRKINPDSKLAALLKLKKTDELTYFNLQRYMSPHFAKAGQAVVATVV